LNLSSPPESSFLHSCSIVIILIHLDMDSTYDQKHAVFGFLSLVHSVQNVDP
jgi:hypothetical protein